jgi:hypothetical protein
MGRSLVGDVVAVIHVSGAVINMLHTSEALLNRFKAAMNFGLTSYFFHFRDYLYCLFLAKKVHNINQRRNISGQTVYIISCRH